MIPTLRHCNGERYGGRNSVGNGTKRLQSGSIHAVFPLFCRRNPSSHITGRFFLENDGRWPAEKRHVIRDDGLRRVIIMVFTVSWSVGIVSDAVFFDLSVETVKLNMVTARNVMQARNSTLGSVLPPIVTMFLKFMLVCSG